MWYAISLGVFLLLPSWKFGFPVWQLPPSKITPFASLALAFVVSATVAIIHGTAQRWRGLGLTVLATMAIFGVVFFGFVTVRTDFSRATTIVASFYAIVLVPLPYLIGATRKDKAIAFAALATLGAITPFLPSELPAQIYRSALIKTEYYNLDVETYSDVFPKSTIVGGGLAQIGDGYLRLSGDGHLYVFGWEAKTEHLAVRALPYRAPINGEEFAVAAGHPWEKAKAEGIQENKNAVSSENYLHTEWFRTHGLLTQEIGSRLRVFVSHDYWKADQDCWVERVSVLDADRAAILRGETGPKWTTLYETTPCLPIHGDGRRRGVSFVGYFGGGRMALSDSQTLLLTVGDFGFDGVASLSTPSQDPTVSYGKTIAINIADGRATMFTLGHRNPEGLFIDHAGTVWSTEHGPQGGDELNQLIRGRNYGWPLTTYGTDYDSFSWPLNKPETPLAYEAPVFAWVPSIGVSSLLEVEGKLFPQWRGDLLIGSLKAQTLFRARVREGHIAYLEPIELGSRIRDVIEGHDGRIIILTDAELLDIITPKDSNSGEALFAEKCSGCHNISRGAKQKIGPNLTSVVNRKVASLDDYPSYSPALRSQRGAWTESRLDQFIRAPHEFSPGTAMDFAGDADVTERSAIIRYLEEQR